MWLFCIDDFLPILRAFLSAVESRPAPFSGGQRQATPTHTPVRMTCRAGSRRTVVCLLRLSSARSLWTFARRSDSVPWEGG